MREFVEAIEAGGVAAMEVLARDMKALGLYAARSLSYEGVAYELVEHRLTDEQIRIYDAYAGAFSIIHNNLDAAMQAANITGATGTLNAQAKSAARSAFESAKQRFFNHLITAMKTPSLIASVERDLEGRPCRRDPDRLDRRGVDGTPPCRNPNRGMGRRPGRHHARANTCSIISRTASRPSSTSRFTDSEGNLSSRPVYRDGQPVQSREAVARRDRLIEKLASLPPVHGALDQIVQRFGADMVAEVTGRSRRIVRKTGSDGVDRLVVENRAGSANLGETQAFMDDAKRILVFSDAGGTGRSYHADLSAKNRRLRVHYLLEAGWKADAAIQGLGRTNRTNQAQPPLFRPIATNVKAEKRFLSTIARRLDTLGAITKGQRQTGGQGLFRPEDNLESHYARDALRQLYVLLVTGKVRDCSLQTFEDATGLKLTDSNGIKDELPPITTFLNRLLALTIDLQNILFTEQLLTARIEGAIASGTYDVGLETLTAESFVVTGRQTIYTHPGTSAETRLLTITQRERNRPVTLRRSAGASLRSPRGSAGQQPVGPRRRAGSGPKPDARRRRGRTPGSPHPPDGASDHTAGDDAADPLAGSRPRHLRPRLGGRSRRGAGVHRQRDSHRRRFACRSGSVCRTNRRGCIGSRPTPASASSAARCRPRGWPVRWKPGRQIFRLTTPSPR